MKKLLSAIGASLLALASAHAYTPEVGDIVFHTSTSAQSAAIQAATHSPYSHMGIVLLRHGKPAVLEAVQPVKYTELKAWLNRGKGQHYVIKRLKSPLSAATASRLDLEARQYLGKPYDLTFEWSDDKIYCSELVWNRRPRNLQNGPKRGGMDQHRLPGAGLPPGHPQGASIDRHGKQGQ